MLDCGGIQSDCSPRSVMEMWMRKCGIHVTAVRLPRASNRHSKVLAVSSCMSISLACARLIYPCALYSSLSYYLQTRQDQVTYHSCLYIRHIFNAKVDMGCSQVLTGAWPLECLFVTISGTFIFFFSFIRIGRETE